MKNNLEKLLHSFISFDYSKQMTDMFHRWMISPDSSEEKETAFYNLWSKTKGKATKNTDQSFQQVLDKLGIERAPMMQISRWSAWKPVAAAAVIVLLSVTATLWVSYSYFDKDDATMVECYVKNGTREKIVLPDGSVIHLNSGSHILYPKNLEGKTRMVYLVGEADFKVAKNPEKPFIVRSSNMMVTALGTEFNVRAYPEEKFITATLIEGKVKVNCNDTTSYVLLPNQQIVYTKNTLTSQLVEANIEDVTAWRRGEIMLTKATIDEIAQALERHYGVRFQVSGTKRNQDRYNFVFKENADITQVLGVLKVVVGGFDFWLKENTCYIYWK